MQGAWRRCRRPRLRQRAHCGHRRKPDRPARIHQPGHPQADAEGYVYMSNVNVVDEMVNMISASRTYQNSIEVLNTSKELLLRTLSLGQ
jgi:flagellar basal-body rod protein FlgC